MLKNFIELSKNSTPLVPLKCFPKCEFVQWTRDNFPSVTNIEFERDGGVTTIGGLDENSERHFSLRQTPVSPPKGVDSNYVYPLWYKHMEQRIHVSEFQDFFGDWIRENFPKVKYVYIKDHTYKSWSVRLDDEFTFVVPC